MMWMMVWMSLFWIVLIGGATWFLLAGRGVNDGDDAVAVLRARLARGEIDTAEFEERKAALGGANPNSARGAVVAVVVAIALVISIPTVIMAASGWDMDMDMWNMGSRSQDTANDPVFRGGSSETVRVEDFGFDPGNLEVPAGATVTWTNEDAASHDATARNGDWRTARLSNDESDTLTFVSPGTFDYYCSIHPGMKARLVVR